jgi:hypothetical protein
MVEHEGSSIRVIMFTGKEQDWSAWEERFLAKARRKGFKNLLLGKETIPNSSVLIDEATAPRKAQKKILNLNDMAYSELILSMDI